MAERQKAMSAGRQNLKDTAEGTVRRLEESLKNERKLAPTSPLREPPPHLFDQTISARDVDRYPVPTAHLDTN